MIVFLSSILPLVFLATTTFAQSPAINGDELQKLLNPTEREHLMHSKELKSDEMHLLLKRRQEKEAREAVEGAERQAAEKAARQAAERAARQAAASKNTSDEKSSDRLASEKPKSSGQGTIEPSGNNALATDKGSSPASGQPGPADKQSAKKEGTRTGRGGDRYMPPSWRAENRKVKIGGFQADSGKEKKGPYFGIRMGAKIRARLPQVTTNVEQNLTEIIVEQDVYGDYKTMPKNTKLFAKKSLNAGSNRLELLAVKGITPQGEEFALKGIVLDISNSAGLVGAVSTDGKAVQRSVAAGVFGLGKDIAPILNDGTVIGAGVEAAASNMMDEKEDETDASLNNPQYIIYVNPQDIKIRVEETF